MENFETIEALDTSSTNVIMNIIERFRDALNDAVVQAIENQRDNFATGWPPRIPPLDPFYIEEYFFESTELEGFASFEIMLNDSYVRGLQQYKVEKVDIRPLTMSALIQLSFEKLEMEGIHSTRATMFQGIFPVTITGNDVYNMTFNNVYISAFVKFGFNNGSLNMQMFVVDFSVGSVITNFSGFGMLTGLFNTLASASFPAILLLQKVELNLRIYEEFIPAVNEILNQITILDLIAVIYDFLKDEGLRRIRDAIFGLMCN
ncbi:hypothetical protein PVAND_005617 [Polypedilum vanderplanki]|uniref:Uncharacterized protein n=1 Tax=Polypedilum vanderplanki TaxID=319348 RepID=A0A9J6C1Q2_POLVA|nr:hypothetical protein PVAND_005617 [Polypedilum vanderplanki]